MRHVPPVAIFCLLLSACGGDTPNQPSASPPPPGATPTRIIGLNGNLAFGNVLVGNTATAALTVINTGTATLTVTSVTAPAGYAPDWTSGTIPAGGSQSVTILFAPTAAQSYSGTLTVASDQTSGTNTIAISGTGTVPAGPRTSFGAGTYRVGPDIASGRYYTDPASGCYWERLSGFGGTLGEILANDFIGFDARQLIVDILATDPGFHTDADCRTWFNTPRFGTQSNITPGTWLVGSQLTPGTYQVNASSGCYWERLRNFTGNLSGIIANDFVSGGGLQTVSVAAGDTGFTPTLTAEPGRAYRRKLPRASLHRSRQSLRATSKPREPGIDSKLEPGDEVPALLERIPCNLAWPRHSARFIRIAYPGVRRLHGL